MILAFPDVPPVFNPKGDSMNLGSFAGIDWGISGKDVWGCGVFEGQMDKYWIRLIYVETDNKS